MELSGFGKALAAALRKREPLRARTDAWRLLNGTASGTPGLIVDHFAGILVAYAYEKDPWMLRPGFAELLAAETGARGIALIDRAARGEDGREEGRILHGEVPELLEVREGELRFAIHPRHPRNVGLFLDTRPLREELSRARGPRDVLNLFSYSCSLGIAAALGNPGGVVNVDVSARYLGWGRDNLALNGFPPERMKFVKMDSAKYLEWAAKKGLSFDAIILDPPSFARHEDGTFAFARDYFRLAAACMRLLRPAGALHALTNYGGIAPAQFRERLEETARAEGRSVTAIARRELPPDFDGAEPQGGGAGMAVEGTLMGFTIKLA